MNFNFNCDSVYRTDGRIFNIKSLQTQKEVVKEVKTKSTCPLQSCTFFSHAQKLAATTKICIFDP